MLLIQLNNNNKKISTPFISPSSQLLSPTQPLKATYGGGRILKENIHPCKSTKRHLINVFIFKNDPVRQLKTAEPTQRVMNRLKVQKGMPLCPLHRC